MCQNDEVSLQRKVRTEVIQLEDTLAQVRKEYEMLRIEFEQTLAANEQAGNFFLHFTACCDIVSVIQRAVFWHSLKPNDVDFPSPFSLSIRPNKSGDASPYQHLAEPQSADEGRGGQIQTQTPRRPARA